MNILVKLAAIIALLCACVIGFKWSMTADAPIPGGGSVPMDHTEMFGGFGEFVLSFHSAAVVGLILSIAVLLFGIFRNLRFR